MLYASSEMLSTRLSVLNARANDKLIEATKLIAANFDQHRQQMVSSTSHVWRWASGVILFPEALCPSCNGVMRSNRIWHVDERAQRVLRAVKLNINQLVSLPMSRLHPHVDSGGNVCTGTANSASEALFLGVGMGTPHWRAGADWYREAFDHTCSASSKRNSRQHLTESIKRGEQAAKSVEVVLSPPTLAVVEERLFSSEPVQVAVPRTGRGLRLEDL